MSEAERLTLAYVEAHPGDAARVLERLPTAQATAFFAALPARALAPAFGAMLPIAAGRVLAELPDEQTVALLSALGTQPALSILRHVPEARRAQLVAELPTVTAVASRLLLGYPDDSVGAWTDPEVVALPDDAAVEDALVRVRAMPGTRVEEIYTVGMGERLLGSIELATLLRAPPHAALETVARKPPAVLPAASPLAGAATHRGWQHSAGLPVVEANERLIGVLRRATLMRALARNRSLTAQAETLDVLGVIANGYWQAIAGLVGAAVSSLPSVRPVGGLRDER
jgi:magnesium transporter